MQFLYSSDAGDKSLIIAHEGVKHLKAQRKRVHDDIRLRNLKDDMIYTYKIVQIQRNEAYLELLTKQCLAKKSCDFTLAWCVIDPKNIEKTLPFLNELGVRKIDFIYSDFSQKNFKLDFERFKRILICSCEQCGRSDLMEFNIFKSLKEYLNIFSNIHVLDFGGEILHDKINHILVGCEGGFSENERKLFKNKVGFKTPLILKSESATITAIGKILL